MGDRTSVAILRLGDREHATDIEESADTEDSEDSKDSEDCDSLDLMRSYRIPFANCIHTARLEKTDSDSPSSICSTAVPKRETVYPQAVT